MKKSIQNSTKRSCHLCLRRLIAATVISFTSLVSIAQAKDTVYFDGLSGGTISTHAKPSLYVLCGNNDAVARSQETVQSVYDNIETALGFDLKSPDLEIAPKVRAKLREIQGDTAASLRLTILRDGKLESVEVLKSSGSHGIDERLCDLVRKAAPFHSHRFPDKLSWALSLPAFDLRPFWLLLPTNQRESSGL